MANEKTKASESLQGMLKALSQISEEEGEKGVIECPNCTGKLHWTRSSHNGHVWGKCETKDCLSWMM